ncbi:MAG: hypothetical protein M1482_13745, partial [Chloroflexi bacterium]|nr:hypothetical protein [Chloroflexota bacterium]
HLGGAWAKEGGSVMIERIQAILGGFHDTTMFLTLVIWLCVVPFVLLFTVPFFGWPGGLTAAMITFLIALAACWGVCLFPKIPEERNTTAH